MRFELAVPVEAWWVFGWWMIGGPRAAGVAALVPVVGHAWGRILAAGEAKKRSEYMRKERMRNDNRND